MKIIYISVPSLTLGKHNLTDFSIHKQTHYSVSKFIFYLGEKVKESQKNCWNKKCNSDHKKKHPLKIAPSLDVGVLHIHGTLEFYRIFMVRWFER